jgi:hypothetical protein
MATKPHVILEGPDGTGKTTLAQHLVDTLGYQYHHEGLPPGEDMLVYYAHLFLQKIKQGPTVFDRLHLGEHVYGPIMRGRSKMQGLPGVRLMQMLIRGKGARALIALPDYQTVVSNWKKRHNAEYVKDEARLKAIYDAYLRLQLDDPGHLQAYDYEAMSLQWMQNWLVRNPTRVLPEDMIGDPMGGVVLVGDMANQHLDLPFFATNGSSGFLHNCLDKLPFYDHLTLCNAYAPDGKPHNLINNLFELYPRSRVIVALGTSAAVALTPIIRHSTVIGLPYVADIVVMDHPQYIKRFHSSRKQEYADYLLQLKNLVPSGKLHRFKL